jgi:hypothetical protein
VSGDASSALLSFRTAPDASTLTAQLPHQFVIYGDLGHKVPTGSSTIMPYVTRDVRDGPPGLPRPYIDMVLHVGDFACARFQSGRSDLPAASSLVLSAAARPTLLRPRSHALRPRLGPTPCMQVLTTAPSPRADSPCMHVLTTAPSPRADSPCMHVLTTAPSPRADSPCMHVLTTAPSPRADSRLLRRL